MNPIEKYGLNRLFSKFDEYTLKEFPELPLNKFERSIAYLESLHRLGDYLKASDFDKAQIELNLIKKEILKHCKLDGFIIKVFFGDNFPDRVAAICEPSGLLNCNIRLKKLPIESYSYVALLIHEIAHIYQFTHGRDLYDEENLQNSERYTDYLTLYRGFSEEVSFGYLLALGGEVPGKLNCLDFDDIEYAIKRNAKIPN